MANAAKSRFLASVSHEIRTPMNGVLGMAKILSATNLTADQRDFVDTISESGVALLELLNDILDLSKIEAGRIDLEKQDFSVAHLLQSVEHFWGHQAAEKNIKLSILNRIDPGTILRTDRNRLRQILYNLVGNAIKFTSDGTIEIQAEEVPRKDSLRELRIEISDTGVGLSDKQMDKIFQPFAQADSSITRKFGGTGLGLSICKNLVNLLGGEIGVESALGQGSRFWFTVTAERGDPTAVLPETATLAEAAAEGSNTGRTAHILVAEDNMINQKVVKWMLAPLSCQIDIVSNGQEAIAAVTRSSYDLVLMDVQMPGMDGVTATKKIRSLSGSMARLPIIALTANTMQGDREIYLAEGMSGYLSKPIDQQELWKIVSRYTGIDLPKATDQSAPPSLDNGRIPTAHTSLIFDELIDGLDEQLNGTDK